jgi:endo-1,4-beta-xylanase
MASLGLLVHISELDINFTRMQKKPDLTLTNEMLQQQKAKYKFIVDTYYETVPKPQRFGITTWNVGDKDSWIRWLVQENEWPLLFDEEYKPKPAFYGFLEGLKNNVNK